jgi:replicative DNA helicase
MNEVERGRYLGALGQVSSLPIYITDKSGINISELPAMVDECKQRFGLDLLVVDYLQLVRGTKNKNWNREQEVAEVARGLKEIALSRQIPVIACCQLNRQVVARTNKTPELSDLRESGEIEQAADIVALLYRDEAYDQESKEPNTATLFIKKNRSGPLGYVKMFCDMRYGIFSNLSMYGSEYGN